MEKNAVIFDLDGTLVHTLPEYRYVLVRAVLKKLGLDATNDFIDRFWFESRRNDLIVEHLGIDPENFWKVYRETEDVNKRKKYTIPYGDVEFLETLKINKIIMGVVTGSPPYIADIELGLIRRDYFGSVVFSNSHHGKKPKPHPESLIECMKNLGVRSENSLYVGNSDEDVLMAKAAKVTSVFIDRQEHEFPHVNPVVAIKSLHDLGPIIGI